MANAPGYDPNDLSEATSASLGNAALQDVYEPGSTSKVMSIAAVLEEGAAAPGTHVTVPNRLHRGDRLFKDDVDHPTWYLTLNGVLAKSSNIGTILATGQLGRTQAESNKVLYDYLRKFGLGEKTGLGYPGESPGLLAHPKDWSTSQQYTIPFGQGLSINAVQAASVYSTVANGGVRVAPTLVRGTKGADGRFTPAEAPRGDPGGQREDGQDPGGHAGVRRRRHRGDRHQGRHPRLPGRGQDRYGQPGRSRPGRLQGLHRLLQPSFAPADDPQITVYCAIQNPTKGSYFGGQICGPIYKQVMEFALKSLQIPPSGSKPPRLPVSFEPGE